MLYTTFIKQVNFRKEFIRMPDVCEIFKNLGLESVVSVLTTGNIIFESNKKKYK
ncbi:MAG: DUF1697 domain-containing protein [Rickettsiales bacterium]|jgi:uncharacterized protein (DUF1697 family)|nr:DUF1697 domain-containing protein [Rickettsiales bacterium]